MIFNKNIFDKQIMNKLPRGAANKLSNIQNLIYIVPLISGLFGGLAMSQLAGESFWYGFFPVTIFAFLIDRFLAQPSSKSIYGFRIALALLFGVINALGLDAYLYKKDVHNFFVESNQQKVIVLDSLSQQKKQIVYEQIAKVQAESDSLYHATIGEWNDRIFTEANVGLGGRNGGFGSFAIRWSKMKKNDSIALAPKFEMHKQQVADLQHRLTLLDQQKEADIAAIIPPEEKGVSERLKALKTIIFGGDNPIALGMYLVFLLICLFLECLIVIIKFTSEKAYLAYMNEDHRQAEQTLLINQMEQFKMMQTMKATIDAQTKADIDKLKHQINLDTQSDIEEVADQYERKSLNRQSKRFIAKMTSKLNSSNYQNGQATISSED